MTDYSTMTDEMRRVAWRSLRTSADALVAKAQDLRTLLAGIDPATSFDADEFDEVCAFVTQIGQLSFSLETEPEYTMGTMQAQAERKARAS